MINIPPFRVKRFTARLRELSIRDAIALAAIPSSMQHEAASFFLKCTLESVEGEATNYEQWTVQERTMVICHYMSNTYDDGPDFSLSGGSKYSDFLMSADYEVGVIDACAVIGDDEWAARQLTGRLACSIERLEGEMEGIEGYAFWSFALLAAQMVVGGDTGDELTESELDKFLLNRMNIISNFPESAYAQLFSAWIQSVEKMQHLIQVSFDSEGVLYLSGEKEPSSDKGGSQGRVPARFPSGSVVTSIARRLGGKYEE